VHAGGDSLFRALQKLHASAEFMRRRAVNKAAALEQHAEEQESEGLRLVRQVRAALCRTSGRQARLAGAASACPCPPPPLPAGGRQ
jgi:hypothetical protein